MRIRRIECQQFAGLHNKNMEFSDGLNLVIGENESGKSTMVDLISQLLFQDVKLDGRSDRDFIETYFPKSVKGPQGDVIDGTLEFETAHGTFRLRKEWESGTGSCRLVLPDGTSIKNNARINEILGEELKYHSGVYREIVFSSQKSPRMAIESIMRELGKKKDEFTGTREALASALTQAVLETGGISTDRIAGKLEERILSLEQHWDAASDLPEGGMKRGIRNPWKQGVGTILEAYYELEQVRGAQQEAEEAEKAVEMLQSQLSLLQKRRDREQEDLRRFQELRVILGRISLLKKRIPELQDKIRDQHKILEDWPKARADLELAGMLREQLKLAVIHREYLKAEEAWRRLEEAESSLKERTAVDAGDIRRGKEAEREIIREESRLSGLNLTARIRQLGQDPVEIRSAVTGEKLDVDLSGFSITQAVEIQVPGVMDMQLMPQGIDLDGIKARLESLKAELTQIYERYQVSGLEELEKKDRDYQEARQLLEQAQSYARQIFRGRSWEEIRTEHALVPEGLEPEEELEQQIRKLCGSRPVEGYIGGLEARLQGYEERYASADDLQDMLRKEENELQDLHKEMEAENSIPEEYQDILDPERKNQQLQDVLDRTDEEVNRLKKDIAAAEKRLGERPADEYQEDVMKKQAVFDGRKEELTRWKHIREVFLEMKEALGGHPVEDLEQRFREYLDLISGGRLELLSINEQMSVKLASADHALTYGILSEGTRETVSLAFRLAMLEHIFPGGGGLAVFDDPFTEMDPKRVEQSVRLIEKFAEHNQVIFVTCDEKYEKLMNGEVCYMA